VLGTIVALESILVAGLTAWVWLLYRRLARAAAATSVAEARHREAERALRHSEANLATAFNTNPCALAIVRNGDGRFLDVNAAFERLTGYPRDEVVDRTFQDLRLWVDPDDLAAISQSLERGEYGGSREMRFRTKTGAPGSAVCSTADIMFGGEPCVLAAALDIVERREAERQAAALREELAHLGRVTLVEALTGSLAHEINQPLTAVMANTEAALRLMTAQPPRWHELRETLNEVLADNRRAADVLERMRTLLKKGATRYEPLELNGIVREVVKLVQNNLTGRQIALDIDLASDLPPVLGDRVQVQQVLLNLVMNAFDAVAAREVTDRHVRLQTASRAHTAIVDVTDRGGGLSDEELSVIFEPFYTTKREGLGLGLSISRAIVTAHGGTLGATRNGEAGMTFSAIFPSWPPPSADQPPSAAARLQRQR